MDDRGKGWEDEKVALTIGGAVFLAILIVGLIIANTPDNVAGPVFVASVGGAIASIAVWTAMGDE